MALWGEKKEKIGKISVHQASFKSFLRFWLSNKISAYLICIAIVNTVSLSGPIVAEVKKTNAHLIKKSFRKNIAFLAL